MAQTLLMDIDGFPRPDNTYHGQISTFSWGQGNPRSGPGGGGTGRVELNEISLTRKQDPDSPFFAHYALTGEHMQKITIRSETRDPDGGSLQIRLGWIFEDAVLTNVRVSGEGTDRTEQITFSFSEMRDWHP
jgi:type VI secretion system secreted protein Hcp